MELSPPEHETSEAVSVAARWYGEHRDECPRPIVPALRSMFGLSAKQACEALAEASRNAANRECSRKPAISGASTTAAAKRPKSRFGQVRGGADA